jgi:hypothetical protein
MPKKIGAKGKKANKEPATKSAEALAKLKDRQENSARIRQLEAYSEDRFKILNSGGTGREANAYARSKAEADKAEGFGYGVPESLAQHKERAEGGLKKGGKVRGYGMARGGKPCKMV